MWQKAINMLSTYRSSTYINYMFTSTQYCNPFILDFALKNSISAPSSRLVYLLVPRTFLTWIMTQSVSTWDTSQYFYFALEVTKSFQYSLVNLPLIWQFPTTWWYLFLHFLDFIFQNFLVTGFSHIIFYSQLHKSTVLEARVIHYIKGTNFGCSTQRKFSRTSWIFL